MAKGKWCRFLVFVVVSLLFLSSSTHAHGENESFSQDEKFTIETTKNSQNEGFDVQKYVYSSRSEFVQAFIASFAMIFVSEIGDKTFFIAAILAMKNPRLVVFTGAFSALALMTILSAALGSIVPALIPHVYTHYLTTLFFFVFGIKMLREYSNLSEDEAEGELQETEEELEGSKKSDSVSAKSLEEGFPQKKAGLAQSFVNLLSLLFSPVWIQAFTLTFLAEWGDRSQITTIAMATTENPFGITLGGIIGHAICTGMAVLGGRLLASRISVKKITLIGAVLFLFFGVLGFYQDPEKSF